MICKIGNTVVHRFMVTSVIHQPHN